MLKFWNKSLLLSIPFLLILAGCGQSSKTSSNQEESAQKELDVRISYNLPAEHATGIYFEELAKEIAKNTANTSIKLNPKTYPNGQLYNDQQLPDAVSNGVVEIGQLNVGFLGGEEAESLRIVDLPFLFNSSEAQWEAEDGEYSELFNQQLEKYNMKMIGYAQYGTVEFYGNKPIKLPKDLKGLKIRAFGKGSSLTIQHLGASPVSMSSQEVYQAMDHGTIDGFSTGSSSVVDRGLYEVTNYGTDMQMNFLSFQAVTNMNWWNNLPEDVQNAVMEASKTAQKASREKAKNDTEHYTQQLIDNGVELYKPSAEEREMWVEAVQADYDNYLKKAGDMGKRLYEAAQKANQNHPIK
jgi:C4-dicarboxylate-binding protein DctP